jgi:hypothetical protein
LRTRLRRDLGGKLEGQDYQWLAAIGLDYENVPVHQPSVKLLKAVGAGLNLHHAVNIHDRNGQVAKVGTAGRTRQWDALGSKATVLQEFDYRAFATIAFIA